MSSSTTCSASRARSYADTKLTVGGTNILDKFPTAQNPDETDNGFKYEAVQFGLNGAAWFVRLAHSF